VSHVNWNGPLAYKLDPDHSPFMQQYLSSLYWSLTALVKVCPHACCVLVGARGGSHQEMAFSNCAANFPPFGVPYTSTLGAASQVPWVSPNTLSEKVFGSVIVVLGAIFFALILGNVVSALQVCGQQRTCPCPCDVLGSNVCNRARLCLQSCAQAFEVLSAQRRDKMGLMHRFASTRRLPVDFKRGMTRYVDQMFAFSVRAVTLRRLEHDPVMLSPSYLHHAANAAREVLTQLSNSDCSMCVRLHVHALLMILAVVSGRRSQPSAVA
jgi:hypothetical protein